MLRLVEIRPLLADNRTFHFQKWIFAIVSIVTAWKLEKGDMGSEDFNSSILLQ